MSFNLIFREDSEGVWGSSSTVSEKKHYLAILGWIWGWVEPRTLNPNPSNILLPKTQIASERFSGVRVRGVGFGVQGSGYPRPFGVYSLGFRA